MTGNGRKKHRSPRGTQFDRPPGRFLLALSQLRRSEIVLRLALCLMSAIAMACATMAWRPPFEFRVDDVPHREITARVDFTTTSAVREDPTTVSRGESLALEGVPLSQEKIALLAAEQRAYEATLPRLWIIERFLASLVVILALQALCGYLILRRDPRLFEDSRRLAILHLMAAVTVLLAHAVTFDPWRAEIIPLLLFGMTVGIAYQRELANIFSLALATVLAMANGHSLGEVIVLAGVVTAAVVQIGRIRSRRKLIKVGLNTALVAAVLTCAVEIVEGRSLDSRLLVHAGRNALWTLMSGFLITGLLPFIEGLFGVLTEISLLELGDVAHPLLQELVRRAPGTYNHSINVGSLGEAAAESIGAKGLLVRVGAYFHDIGKMLKPDYFVENQGLEGSRHDALNPAMSTLIIIAHIKDGADLARQHKLPRAIIDLIEQHHGTTLVEYFFRRASERQDANPDASDPQESSFRYPGPKPQTIEAAVLMLADAVESASRALVDPAPARIENLVESVAMKKLLDGQFDECGLTLRKLRLVQESLIKSLTSAYHGRVKYPDQQSA